MIFGKDYINKNYSEILDNNNTIKYAKLYYFPINTNSFKQNF